VKKVVLTHHNQVVSVRSQPPIIPQGWHVLLRVVSVRDHGPNAQSQVVYVSAAPLMYGPKQCVLCLMSKLFDQVLRHMVPSLN
jgi:hypothetical protein